MLPVVLHPGTLGWTTADVSDGAGDGSAVGSVTDSGFVGDGLGAIRWPPISDAPTMPVPMANTATTSSHRRPGRLVARGDRQRFVTSQPGRWRVASTRARLRSKRPAGTLVVERSSNQAPSC
jgi:hypothetical protein